LQKREVPSWKAISQVNPPSPGKKYVCSVYPSFQSKAGRILSQKRVELGCKGASYSK